MDVYAKPALARKAANIIKVYEWCDIELCAKLDIALLSSVVTVARLDHVYNSAEQHPELE